MLCVCFCLKLTLRISRFRSKVTHTYKTEDKNKLKKYNIAPPCTLYIHSLPFFSSHNATPSLILQPWRPHDILNWDTIVYLLPFQPLDLSTCSLRSRRLEIVGERENGGARGRHACLLLARPFFLCPLLPSACYAGYLHGSALHYIRRYCLHFSSLAYDLTHGSRGRIYKLNRKIERAD